jgi:excisionase family DNA binding protein
VAIVMSANRVRRQVPRLAFNQQEAAEALGISVDHFERHVKADLPVVYSGSLRLYPRTALERWLAEHEIRGGRRVA